MLLNNFQCCIGQFRIIRHFSVLSNKLLKFHSGIVFISKSTSMIEKTVKYKKSAPKPENDSSVRIPALFKSLYQQILNSNYQNALKTTNKLLRLDNRSDELIKTRIFLLLQLDCFDLALDSLQQSKFSFEWAYSEYRRKNEKAAENVVESPSNTSRKWLILKAQLVCVCASH